MNPCGVSFSYRKDGRDSPVIIRNGTAQEVQRVAVEVCQFLVWAADAMLVLEIRNGRRKAED